MKQRNINTNIVKTLLLILVIAVQTHHINSYISHTHTSTFTFTSTSTHTLTPSQKRQIRLQQPKYRILILPGFLHSEKEYTNKNSLIPTLVQDCHWDPNQIRVLPITIYDWVQVFTKGLLDINFWKGNVDPNKSAAFKWYLDLVEKEVQTLNDDDCEGIILIGHSAGGWLARAALGVLSQKQQQQQLDVDYNKNGPTTQQKVDLSRIACLVTLGSPHISPNEGCMDITRGALRNTNENYPGAYLSPNITYISVIGSSVQGKKESYIIPLLQKNSLEGFAFISYDKVCGEGNQIGDGVVPCSAGHLDGAIQIDLDDVQHSMSFPGLWYGSSSVIHAWHDVMLKLIVDDNDSDTDDYDNVHDNDDDDDNNEDDDEDYEDDDKDCNEGIHDGKL
mmetsp:Transcript_12269/g.15174  ORF Transcript_12269/g.15174 Transcript_12269/m.15174 type:complete len:391 (-) Transcript_12269:386-1558(-)